MNVYHAKSRVIEQVQKILEEVLKLGIVPEVKFNEAEAVKSRNFSSAINGPETLYAFISYLCILMI